MSSCLVNCTIPVKLRDYLKEKGINRSELFRKAALQMYEHEICSKCYGNEIADTYKGKFCRDCNHWLFVKRCVDCDELYSRERAGRKYEDRTICVDCFNKYNDEVHDWINEELSRSNDDL